MRALKIEDNRIYLDGTEIMDVTEYTITCSAAKPGAPTAELTLKVLVDPSKLSFNGLAHDVDGNFSEGIQRE